MSLQTFGSTKLSVNSLGIKGEIQVAGYLTSRYGNGLIT